MFTIIYRHRRGTILRRPTVCGRRSCFWFVFRRWAKWKTINLIIINSQERRRIRVLIISLTGEVRTCTCWFKTMVRIFFLINILFTGRNVSVWAIRNYFRLIRCFWIVFLRMTYLRICVTISWNKYISYLLTVFIYVIFEVF